MGLVYFRINGALNAIPMAPLVVDWVNLTFGNNVLI